MDFLKKGLKTTAAIAAILALGYQGHQYYDGQDTLPKEIAQESEPSGYTTQELLEMEIARKKAKREAGYAKANKPNEYTKYFEAIRTPWGEEHAGYLPNYRLLELKKAKNNKAAQARTQNLNWVERGPANVPGRTRGLLVDFSDASLNTWFAGSVAGGIWKTTDGGASWVNKTPDLPNMATTSIVASAAKPEVMYAGTGESFAGYNGVNGDGIFKSTDGGESWTQLAATANSDNFRSVNRLLVSPTDENLLYAVTSLSYWGGNGPTSKIMKTTDGGANWTMLYSANRDIEHIVANPANFSTLLASVNGVGVIKSTDGGNSWYNTKGMQPSGRIELAYAPSDPNYVYASAVGLVSKSGPEESAAGSDLWVSVDGGENWELAFNNSLNKQPDFLGGQGWYDNTLVVNPYREDEVYVGGVDLYRFRIGEGENLEPDFLGTDLENTQSFLSFVPFGQDYFNGQLSLGSSLTQEEFKTVEVRFGPGKKQLAHRFTVPANGGTNSDGGAGIPAADFSYQDYVEVPFEVWDVDNNQQLMVSFRDQEGDGAFNLKDRQYSDDELLDNREYIYIHAMPYEATPAEDIAVNGGQEVRNMYFFWPTLTPDATFEPDNLPESVFRIKYGSRQVRKAASQLVCDAYNRFGGPNGFAQVTNETSITGVHPDHHNILALPVDTDQQTFKLMLANDGGMYISNVSIEPGTKEGDWTFAGNGYNTTQFYGIDKHPSANEYIGGTQDNGTWRSPAGVNATATTKFQRQLGGDGFEVVWHYEDPEKLIGSLYYNRLVKSIDGGETWTEIMNHPERGDGSGAPFMTKIASHKSNSDVLFTVGNGGVYKSTDFGSNWKTTEMADPSGWVSASFTDVEISLANPKIVWAGSGMNSEVAGVPGSKISMYVSTDGGNTFEETTIYDEVGLGYSTGVYTHPTEDSTAFVLFSFSDRLKILKTTDLGQSWTDISGFNGDVDSATGFPDVAVYCLLVMPHDPNQIWVGTEIGLVISNDGGKTWQLDNSSLPNVSIWDMKAFNGQVILGTHARGIWTADLAEIPTVVQRPKIINTSINFKREALIEVNLPSAFDSVQVLVNDIKVGSVNGNAEPGQLAIELNLPWTGNLASITAAGFKSGVSYEAETELYLTDYPLPVSAFVTAFDRNALDFISDGFSVRFSENFAFNHLHSLHPYADNATLTHRLKKPIIVAENNATVRFEDIALIAPDGDYVAVEATRDGKAWVQLEKYDASSSADWSAAVSANDAPTPAMFADREINLHDAFAAGDTLQLRFVLKSNESGTSYGWVMRNLRIQSETPLAFEDEVMANALSMRVYPNPAVGPTVNLEYHLPKASQVAVELIDLSGRVVQQLDLGKQPAGTNRFPYTLPASEGRKLNLLRLITPEGTVQQRILR